MRSFSSETGWCRSRDLLMRSFSSETGWCRFRNVIATGIAVLVAVLGLAACGGGQRQDVTEPSGNFPVQVTKSSFPTRQDLAQTSDLELAIKNTGDQTIPDLAVTIYTG